MQFASPQTGGYSLAVAEVSALRLLRICDWRYDRRANHDFTTAPYALIADVKILNFFQNIGLTAAIAGPNRGSAGQEGGGMPRGPQKERQGCLAERVHIPRPFRRPDGSEQLQEARSARTG